MAAPFVLSNDSVVVIIGTGASGGVLTNELPQKGVGVVALKAGRRDYAAQGEGNLARPGA